MRPGSRGATGARLALLAQRIPEVVAKHHLETLERLLDLLETMDDKG